MKRSEHR